MYLSLVGASDCQILTYRNPFRWDLIAGRIPGRNAVEVERFWIMRHREAFADKRSVQKKVNFNVLGY